MPAAVPPFIRLLKNYRVDPNKGCWLWQGTIQPNGYGTIKVFGNMVLAHRYSRELHCGPIPAGLEVMHSCDCKSCINPDHLLLGTHQQNMSAAKARGLMLSGSNHPCYGKESQHKGVRNKAAIQVRVCGKVYGSISEAERALGTSNGTVRLWLKNNPSKAQIITRKEYESDAQ